MGKSIRSKSKRKFRIIKRASLWGEEADKRLHRLTHELHKGSKVVHVEEPEPLKSKFSFSFKEVLLDAPIRERVAAEAAAKMEAEDAENTTFGEVAAMEVDATSRKSESEIEAPKRKRIKVNKFTGTVVTKTTKQGKRVKVLKW
ncbi:hypothetical protein BC828DRAFT_395786 [Blastocladiella britannica]|nr:hypothetical protein BC828DRAFT_395786 [Blastocladiella britannica]